jgi:hypothetical protein
MRMASDIATCVDHTSLVPLTAEKAYIADYLREREHQRALMQLIAERSQ